MKKNRQQSRTKKSLVHITSVLHGTAELPGFLHRYQNADFILQQKVLFIYRIALLLLGLLLIALAYSLYVQLIDSTTDKLNWMVLIAELSGLVAFLLCLHLLAKGRYAFAAQLLLLSGLVIGWFIVWAGGAGDPLRRLDTVVLVLGILSMSPLLLEKGRFAIPVYYGINFLILSTFMLLESGSMTISLGTKIDFYADTTLALLFMSFVSYNIHVIYKNSLDRVIKENAERRGAEAAMRQNSKRFSDLFNKAPVPMALFSVEGEILDLNIKANEMLGYTLDDFADRLAWQRQVVPDAAEWESIRQSWQAHFRSAEAPQETSTKREHIIRCKDNSLRTVLIYADRVDDAIIVSLIDISDRKKAETENRSLQEQLFQAQKIDSIGKLAGGVAHDFNNMLGVILGYADMALDQVEPEHPLHADLVQIIEAANRSTKLTRQLLAFARRQTIMPRQLNLNTVIESQLVMLKRLIGEDIRLKWHPQDDIWPLVMDPSQIDQILTNLCVNARDAIGGIGEIHIHTGNVSINEEIHEKHVRLSPGPYVQITFSDNGSGMDKATQDQIFEPFYTTKPAGKGTGLGLSTLYGIVRQNNGFVTVYSEPGMGASFKIYLPVAESEHNNTEAAGAEDVQENPGGTILVVEDEPALLHQSCLMLEKLGYTVLAAANPLDGLKLAEQHEYINLVTTDVIMPDMNGRDLVQKVRELRPGVKSLYVSGYADDILSPHGILDSDTPFLEKPFSRTDLAAKLRQILADKRSIKHDTN